MIKANELRIGNYFLDKCTNEYHVINNWSYPLNEVIKHINPIPLTEEILLSKTNIRYIKQVLACNVWENENIKIYKMIGDYPFYFSHGNKEVKIKYLHQLQNLYFVLTQKELEIKN